MAYLVNRQAERGCITTWENSSIQDLVALLAKHNVGAVVVVDNDDKPTGIVSERDIVRYLDKSNLSLSTIMVAEIMRNGVHRRCC